MNTSATSSTYDWSILARKSIAGELLTKVEALSILQADDDELLPILQAAYQVRYRFFAKRVKLNMIMNAKSGHCREDCGYCSQSSRSSAPIEKYTMLDKETLLKGAEEAITRKAGTYCIVASGRGPTEGELQQVIEAVKEIKQTSSLKICACLGLLKPEQASRLAVAGVDRYNHNINTSKDNYASITTTHTYDQRTETIENAKTAGMSPCSGVIIGMGETLEEIVEMTYTLRAIDADSIPINFLNPILGTPLAHIKRNTPRFCLKVIALFRFICPTKEVRIAGGRELNLGHLQPLALYAANSVFVGDYLTTAGQAIHADHQMIADMGFEIEENAFANDHVHE
ncbi:biotin synthase BioB [Brevibacillus laterosporus]|uniref:biotin synthase BioB n=1 Tax=Brevibacillus laterosporus TaxID=1465 RepID=UPI0018CDDCC7|nr:biotin synthase BioB [Brevibacillus laterosporus]MBG9787956.1 biotin synthase [Brevibacillus laterosporus]